MKASRSLSYHELLQGTISVRSQILQVLEQDHLGDVEEKRVAFLVPSGSDYVQIQWGIWAAGGIAVPLCTTHPFAELEYTIQDSDSSLLFLHEDYLHHKQAFEKTFPNLQIIELGKSGFGVQKEEGNITTLRLAPIIDPSRRALIIYTSGTTSKPKGCVSTHDTIFFQASSLVEAWKYGPSDHLIHVLPLHHVHGIINGLTATLLAGGTVELHPKFDPAAVWRRWMEGGSTMFMAVPTVYSRLVSYFNENIAGTPEEEQARLGSKRLRLVVSGSSALPLSIRQEFHEITGQTLLERYGMTEIGMGLSCRYEDADEAGRPVGSVGWPLGGVEVRLVAEGGQVIEDNSKEEGEIQVRGRNVFKEYVSASDRGHPSRPASNFAFRYWGRAEATSKEYTTDGFFKTGDIAFRDDHGAYFISGRQSVDIIKSGGYKISALDVEREILSHVFGVREVAVVGIEDTEWGERVAAVVAFEQNREVGLKEFRDCLRSHIAPYKIPTVLKVVSEIPRNAMGKVNKKQLVRDLWC